MGGGAEGGDERTRVVAAAVLGPARTDKPAAPPAKCLHARQRLEQDLLDALPRQIGRQARHVDLQVPAGGGGARAGIRVRVRRRHTTRRRDGPVHGVLAVTRIGSHGRAAGEVRPRTGRARALSSVGGVVRLGSSAGTGSLSVQPVCVLSGRAPAAAQVT